MSEKPSFSSVIANKGFRYLWFNQILVQLAYNTLNFALIIWVYKLVGSNLAVSVLMLSIYFPVILFGIFAGVFVDIADRRKIILAIDILLSVAFLLFILIKRSYPLILLNTFLVNSLAQFFMPSESSSIPMLVSKKQLFLANSLFSLTLYGAFMVGFSLGGPVLNHLGINAIFYLGSLALFSAFFMARNLPSIKVSRPKKSFGNLLSLKNFRFMVNLTLKEGKETIEFARGRVRVAAAIGLMSAVQGVIGVLAVAMPDYLERVLMIHASDSSYFLVIPLGLGMITGALGIGRFLHGKSKRSIVVPAVIGTGLVFLFIGAVPALAHLLQLKDLPFYMGKPRYFFHAPSLSFWLGIASFFVGIFMVSIIVPCQTVLQESTTERNRGKIFAVLAVVMTGFAAIPTVVAGGIADVVGVTPLITAMGAVAFIFGIIALRPNFFFREKHLPFKLKEFLGLGHWIQ